MTDTTVAGAIAPAALLPVPDGERVLGRIERGEIWCDPDAARTVAARHQAAFERAAADILTDHIAWADACAALTTGDLA